MAWFCMMVYGMMYHEMWRDEMRALSISIQTPSYLDLPSYLKNEGHPILWYLVLKLCFDIFHDTAVLPVLSILFASGIVFLLLFRSPLPLLLCAFIIFGTWCLYDYGINCRNYGIGAFLLLLFAELYSRNPKNIILHACILALAAQTNIYAAVMSMFIGLWMLSEVPREELFSKKTFTTAGIICASFLFVVYVTLPDKNSLVVGHQPINMEKLGSIWDIGHGFGDLLFTWFPYKRGLVTSSLLLSLLLFIPKPKSLLLLYMAAVFMAFFSLCIRYNYIQHQGMWIYLYILLFHIHYSDIKLYLTSHKGIRRYLVYTGLLAFSLIMLSSTFRGVDSWLYDIHNPKSDSRDAGAWFNKNYRSGDVVISEPDYIMEPVMYYHYHDFYLPREKTFNTFVHFTKANDSFLSLKNMLHIADSFQQAGKNPIIVLRDKLSFKDSIMRHSYEKYFMVDTATLRDFDKRYHLVDSFRHNYYTDEQYNIYRKRKY